MGVTDLAWASFLRNRDDLTEINFWVPSGRPFTGRARPDEPFLFKTKSPHNELIGGGFFDRFWDLRVSDAWDAFGQGNGCATHAELDAAIQGYRARHGIAYEADPGVGCIVLRNPFFAEPGDELPQPQG